MPSVDEIAERQALSLVALACELDEPTYIEQLQAIDRPHLVVNSLVSMIVRATPQSKWTELANMLRNRISVDR